MPWWASDINKKKKNYKTITIIIIILITGKPKCLQYAPQTRKVMVDGLVSPQIYRADPRTNPFFIPAWGTKWGSSGFSCSQNNHGLSGAYVTCIYCDLSVKINMGKMLHGTRRSWTRCFGFAFACEVNKNSKTLNLSLVADNAITWGGMYKVRISLEYLWVSPNFVVLLCKRISVCLLSYLVIARWKLVTPCIRKPSPWWWFYVQHTDMHSITHGYKVTILLLYM